MDPRASLPAEVSRIFYRREFRGRQTQVKHHFHENIRFCPRCGVGGRLERDYFRQAPAQPGGPEKQGIKGQRQVPNGSEWICDVCHFGFRILKSGRHSIAEDLFRRDRKLRNAVTLRQRFSRRRKKPMAFLKGKADLSKTRLKMQDLGLCVCGGKISASTNPPAVMAVMHSIPYCEQFEKLDPEDFLAFVRMSREPKE
jgi:hypothetical protein